MAENRAWRGGRAAALGAAAIFFVSAATAQTPPPPPLTPATPSGPGLTPAPATPPLLPAQASPPAAMPAPPPVADPSTVIRIGLLTGENGPYRLRQAEPFREYLEARTGAHIEMIGFRDYASLIDAQVESLVQYAVYSASAFATAEALCACVEPIAAPADPDGSIGFYSVLVARADGPIATLEQARGSTLALVSGDSIAGRLIPLSELPLAGVDPAEFFSPLVDVPDPEAALAALLAGDVDVAVAWSTLSGDPQTGFSRGSFARMVGGETLAMDQLRVVWQSELIPYGPHAIRSDMPPSLKSALSEALLAMSLSDPAAVDAIDRGGAVGFVTPDPAIYDPLRRLVSIEDEAPVVPTP